MVSLWKRYCIPHLLTLLPVRRTRSSIARLGKYFSRRWPLDLTDILFLDAKSLSFFSNPGFVVARHTYLFYIFILDTRQRDRHFQEAQYFHHFSLFPALGANGEFCSAHRFRLYTAPKEPSDSAASPTHPTSLASARFT